MDKNIFHLDQLAGETAVVTGAASGIGLALCKAFAQQEMNIVLADIDQEQLNTAEATIKSFGVNTLSLVTDVSDPKDVKKLCEKSYAEFGSVAVLCNNAGVSGTNSTIKDSTSSQWNWVMGVNFYGVVYGIQNFLPRMQESTKLGFIINTASIAGLLYEPNMGIYNSSKAAVVALTETLHKECQDSHINVSMLCPSWVNTNIAEVLRYEQAISDMDLSSWSEEEITEGMKQLEEVRNNIANGLNPEEVADAVLDAMSQGQLYILTHHATRTEIEQRFHKILA